MKKTTATIIRSPFCLALLLSLSLPVAAQTKSSKPELKPAAQPLAVKGAAAQQQANTSDEKGDKQTGPKHDPVGGPAVSVGNRSGVNTNLQEGKNKGSAADAVGSGASGAASQARQDATGALTNSNINNRPGFDQGFRNNDEAIKRVNEAAGSVSGNPLDALTGGQSTGGSGPSGIAGQGKGAISSGGLTSASGAKVNASGEVKASGTAAEAEARAREAGIPVTSGGVMGAFSSVGSGPASEILKEIDAEGKGTPAAAPAAAPAAEPPLSTQSNKNFKLFPSGASSEKSEDGNTVTHTSADEKVVTQVTTDPKTGDKTVVKTVTNDDGSKTTTTTSDASTDTPCDPTLDGCNDPAARDAFLRNHSATARQIKQSQSGAGTVDPGRGDSVPFAVEAGAVVPSSSAVGQNLFGQPGRVPREGGSGQSGPNFNGDAGAIDPGPDAVIVGSGRQDDPGDVFNSQPGPTGIGSGRSGSSQTSTSTSTSNKDCEAKKGKTKRLLAVGVANSKKTADCDQ